MTVVMDTSSHDEFLLPLKKTHLVIQCYAYSNVICAYIVPLKDTGQAEGCEKLLGLIVDRVHTLSYDKIF